MRKQLGFTVVELVVAAVLLLGAGGWIANIVKMICVMSEPITGMFIFRGVGIFVVPLGAILGFF